MLKLSGEEASSGSLSENDNARDIFFRSYQRTYIERDVDCASVSDMVKFTDFLSLCAGLTGQEINYAHLGREMGVAGKTAKSGLL